MGEERRRSERYEKEFLGVSLRNGSKVISDFDVIVRDVSRSGLCLQVAGRMDVGDNVGIQLQLPDGFLMGTAAVRWVQDIGNGCRCGVELDGLGFWGRRRLASYLDPLQRETQTGLDRMLWAGILGVSVLILANALGFDIASPFEIFSFLF